MYHYIIDNINLINTMIDINNIVVFIIIIIKHNYSYYTNIMINHITFNS